jgi:hypothetical protein
MRTFILFSILFGFISMTQLNAEKSFDVTPIHKVSNYIYPLSDSIGKIEFHTGKEFVRHNKGEDQMQGLKDTITTYYDRGSGFGVYPITVNNYQYPLTGWNPIFFGIGSHFSIPGQAEVEGVLVAYMLKTLRGSNYDQFFSLIYPCEQGLPSGQALAMKEFKIQDIDTNKFTPVFTPIMFDEPANVNGDFCSVLTTFDGTNEYDATAIFSNSVGDGNNENSVVVMVYTMEGLVSMTLADILYEAGVSDPNFDILILPIINTETSGIESGSSTYATVYPNPAKDFLQLDVNFTEPSEYEVDIINSNGEIVISKTGFANAYDHKGLSFDVSNLPSGNYFYAVRSSGSKYAGKFIISH